jgi:hypothetical protein
MTWNLEDIESDWLGGGVSALAASPDDVVAAFDRTEDALGREWIENSRISFGNLVRGVAPTLRVVDMGQHLAALGNAKNPERLISRIRTGDLSAEAELTAIYLLRPRNLEVELELYPKVAAREADFRVRAAGDVEWTYVEVTQLSKSEAHERAVQIMERLVEVINPVNLNFALEVFLRREPKEAEIQQILGKAPEFCNLSGEHRQELPNSLGLLSLNQSAPGEIVTHTHGGEENVSRIGIARVLSGASEPRRHISVRMTFSDDRAEAMLNAEARQLPKDAPGLIMAGVGGAAGAMETWKPALLRRFQPKIHTRVGGVCLWRGGLLTTPKGEDQVFETKIILNQHARFPLQSWIVDTLTKIGQGFGESSAGRS